MPTALGGKVNGDTVRLSLQRCACRWPPIALSLIMDDTPASFSTLARCSTRFLGREGHTTQC